MNKIFTDLNYNSLYEKCIMASIAHAIMVGKYDLLASEQSWDGNNYNFQNMEGVRGVISFSEDCYVCVIQNDANYYGYRECCVSELFYGADETIVKLADEALQYMLIEYQGNSVPFISVAFWGTKDGNFSNQLEDEILSFSEKMIVPFLYSENDVKEYWKDYYEMTEEQVELMEEVYGKRIKLKGSLKLNIYEKDRLEKWFGNIEDCIEVFQELNILTESNKSPTSNA